MINQANRRPGYATCLSVIRSKPFAPIFTFQKSRSRGSILLFATIYYYIVYYAKVQEKFIFNIYGVFSLFAPKTNLLPLEKVGVRGYNAGMDLSIVIPARNESKKIGWDVEAASAFLKSNHLTGEIIVVDDGSGDGTTKAAKNVKVSPSIPLKVIRLSHHRGKGYAIRTGIKIAQGEYVMFADSGCCVPYGNVLHGLSMLKS
jgi:cellulose synthase/poly-beta-1,6-N-acetylglucosamine synthase-like glycosyltransferase